jgi:hypothetical protein
VRLGVIPGLDIAPLALALADNLFDGSQLRLVTIPFANWDRLEEKLLAGELDAAITSATTPLAQRRWDAGRKEHRQQQGSTDRPIQTTRPRRGSGPLGDEL